MQYDFFPHIHINSHGDGMEEALGRPPPRPPMAVIVIVTATEALLLKGSENTVTLFTVNKRTPKGMKCE